MSTIVSHTLLRLLILRAQMKGKVSDGSSFRKYLCGDGKHIENLILEINVLYAAERKRVAEAEKEGLSYEKINFVAIRDGVLDSAESSHQWSEETKSFYSSVVSRYYALKDQKNKPNEFTLTLAELIEYERMFFCKR